MSALIAELRVSGKFMSTGWAACREPSAALEAELRGWWVFLLALRALHRRLRGSWPGQTGEAMLAASRPTGQAKKVSAHA